MRCNQLRRRGAARGDEACPVADPVRVVAGGVGPHPPVDEAAVNADAVGQPSLGHPPNRSWRTAPVRGTILHAPGDVRFEERPDPTIVEPTDAIVRTVAVCVCGSDLWPYRGIDQVTEPGPIGHEYCGIVEQVGGAVTNVQPGRFVIGGFGYSDDTCPICRAGFQSNCLNGGFDGCQSELIRIPQADGTLVATPVSRRRTSFPAC